MKKILIIISTLFTLISVAEAKDVKSNGYGNGTYISNEMTTLSDGNILSKAVSKEIWIEKNVQPGYPEYQEATCGYSTLFRADYTTISSVWECVATDMDGDFLTLIGQTNGTPESSKYYLAGGSGKYEGMTGSGVPIFTGMVSQNSYRFKWSGMAKYPK